MAEALAILGLASNIISFVDFGMKVVSAMKAVKDSTQGLVPGAHELECILENINASIWRCRNRIRDKKGLSEEERNVLNMAKECEALGAELEQQLDQIKLRHDARWVWRERFRVAVSSIRSGDEIRSLANRLNRLSAIMTSSLRDILLEYDTRDLSRISADLLGSTTPQQWKPLAT